MDVAHPIRVVGPTLDGPALEVLARTNRSLTGREVHQRMAVGSVAGVRLALIRLVEQGLVHADPRSAAIFYSVNRDHLAWPAMAMLVSLREQLLARLRGLFPEWPVHPLHVSLFGSTARGDGDSASDIDILLVRPEDGHADAPPWADQVDDLRKQVLAWTGNNCQPFEVDRDRLAQHVHAGDPIVDEWLRDSVTIFGPDLRVLLRTLLSKK